jgi:hypothetical protein
MEELLEEERLALALLMVNIERKTLVKKNLANLLLNVIHSGK